MDESVLLRKAVEIYGQILCVIKQKAHGYHKASVNGVCATKMCKNRTTGLLKMGPLFIFDIQPSFESGDFNMC